MELAKVCGNTKYSRVSYPSSSNVITLEFLSGTSGDGPGFLAVIETGTVLKETFMIDYSRTQNKHFCWPLVQLS